MHVGPSSPNQTQAPCVVTRSLTHWTTKDVLASGEFKTLNNFVSKPRFPIGLTADTVKFESLLGGRGRDQEYTYERSSICYNLRASPLEIKAIVLYLYSQAPGQSLRLPLYSDNTHHFFLDTVCHVWNYVFSQLFGTCYYCK